MLRHVAMKKKKEANFFWLRFKLTRRITAGNMAGTWLLTYSLRCRRLRLELTSKKKRNFMKMEVFVRPQTALCLQCHLMRSPRAERLVPNWGTRLKVSCGYQACPLREIHATRWLQNAGCRHSHVSSRVQGPFAPRIQPPPN